MDTQRDAMILLTGLGASAEHRGPAHITEVLCHELDRAAGDAAARFAVRPSALDDPAGGEVGIVHTISRIDGDKVTPVLDVYPVDPQARLGGEQTPSHAVARVLTLGPTVVAGVLIWLTAWASRDRHAKDWRQLLQLLLCFLILLLVGGYLVVAVVALLQLIVAAWAAVDGSAPQLTRPQGVVVVGAVLGTVLPNAREQLTKTAEDYVQVMRYLWATGSRSTLRGEVLTVLERIAERPEIGAVHLVGFSFGSLVALDTVLPSSRQPTDRIKRIMTLVTIGCPFDVVRMLHPSYPAGRFAHPDGPPRWVNVYEPIDVLGSRFADTGGAPKGFAVHGLDGERTPDVSLAWNPGATLSWVGILMLASLRVHAQYWGPHPTAESALGLVVAELFQGTPVLR